MNAFPAIGIIEFSSIASGVLSGDAMLKRAPISMIKAGTVSRGKYLVLIGGSVASVDEALAEGLDRGGDLVVDALFLPHVHPRVVEAALGDRHAPTHEALGVMEVKTVAANLRGADAGIKEAEVDITEIRLADAIGGKAFTVFSGRVEDVEAALAKARAVQPNQDVWLHHTVIPRLDLNMSLMLGGSSRFAGCAPMELEHGEE